MNPPRLQVTVQNLGHLGFATALPSVQVINFIRSHMSEVLPDSYLLAIQSHPEFYHELKFA